MRDAIEYLDAAMQKQWGNRDSGFDDPRLTPPDATLPFLDLADAEDLIADADGTFIGLWDDDEARAKRQAQIDRDEEVD